MKSIRIAVGLILPTLSACSGGSSGNPGPNGNVVVGPATLAAQVVTLERGFTDPVFGDFIATGDVDRDGRPDVFFGGRIQRNLGDGSFAAIDGTLPTSEHLRAAAFGDLDGDGDDDLAVVVHDLGLRVWRNAGDGHFEDASAQLPPIGSAVNDVAIGDVDGDGDRDLLVGKAATQDRLLVNDGAGNFADVSALRMPVSIDSARVLLGDFDGDGDLDALCGRASRYLRNDAGTFVLAPSSNPPQLFASDLAAGDLDGDGDLDLVVTRAAPTAPTVFLLLNDGSAHFTDRSNQLPVVNGYDDVAAAVAIGDVDGDGDRDILVGDRIFLLLNDGAGFFSFAPAGQLAQSCGVFGARLTDLDGDGDLDALFTTQPTLDCEHQRPLNLVQWNDGHGVFRPWSRWIGAPEGGVTGDFDGDLDLDFINNPSWLYENDGRGSFQGVLVSTRLTPPPFGRPLAAHDFDLDGRDDLLFSDGLWLADAGGNGHQVQVPGMEYVVAAAVADFDGDGDGDVVLARALTGSLGLSLRYWRGEGNGAFSDESAASMPGELLNAYSVVAGDIDGDGDVDFAVATDAGSVRQVRVGRNDGTGSFQFAPELRIDVAPAWSAPLALADIDGDRDLDVLLPPLRTHCCWENRGNVGFVNRSASVAFGNSAPLDSNYLSAGDFDGDGDVDVLAEESSGVSVYLQDAPFVFRHDGPSRIAHWGLYPRLFPALPIDMDGDGDLEWDGRTNLARHLHAASLATVGRPYSLRLFANPGWLSAPLEATVFVGVDPAPVAVATPAGVFRVGAAAIALPAVTIPRWGGQATLQLTVPAVPVLVGLQLQVQALCTDPRTGESHLTNAVADVIGN